MSLFDVIAFDADDTLWHSERLYFDMQTRFAQLLAQYHSPEWISERLYQTEARNLQHFGYGVKAFALSMIETAVELTEGRISSHDIQMLIGMAKEMLNADVQLLDDVNETLSHLAITYRLMVITKGDLLDQERKIERSGLAPYFYQIEVVSQKNSERYDRLLQRHALQPNRFLMVGNSLRSDIWPVLELGSQAVYIPYEITWLHEAADSPPVGQKGFHQLEKIGQLPALLEQLEQKGT